MTSSDDPPRAGPARGPRWRSLVLLFVVALAVRGVFLQQLASTPFVDERGLIEDTLYYDLRAREIASGRVTDQTVAYLSPLYCDLLGAQYALFGPSLLGAKWLQAVLGALTCVLVARIGARVFGTRVGLLAGTLLALYGVHVYYVGVLLPTTVVVFLNIASAWILVEGRRPPSVARLLLAGVVVGLATAAKSNAILLVPAFALWAWRRRPDALSARAAGSAALVLGTALGLAPYTWRNFRASGELVLVSANGGLNLLKGNGPSATGSHAFLDPGVTDVNLADFIAGEVTPERALSSDRRMKAEARRYALDNPGHTSSLAWRKLGLFLHPVELGIRDQYRFVRQQVPWLSLPWVSFAWIAPLGLVGALFARRRARDSGVLYALLAVQIATMLIVFVLARYRLVAAVCLILFASAELARWHSLWRERNWRPLLAAAALSGLAAAYAWSPVRGYTFVEPFADQYRFVGDAHEEAGRYQLAIDNFRAGCDYPWANGLEDTRALERFIRRNERKLSREPNPSGE